MTSYSELPDNELKEAVAKKLGYTDIVYGFGDNPIAWNPEKTTHTYVPDFPNSLDACEPVFEWFFERGYGIHVGRKDNLTILIITKQGDWVFDLRDTLSVSRALCLAFMEVPADGSDRQEE